jgi:hypothetical protein
MCDSSITYGVKMVEKEMKKDQYYRSRDELIAVG